MDLSLLFLGTAGSVPSARRGLPALLMRRGGERILIDCGEGTQRQLVRSVGLVDLDLILLTHFHTDHWLGLPGMLKSFALREREKPLRICGPRGIDELGQLLGVICGRLPYELEVVELDAGGTIPLEDGAIAMVEASHRGTAAGYVLIEDERPGHLDAELAVRLGVTPGPDLGRLQRGETVAGVAPEQVMGPARRGRRIVFSGDTAPCESIAAAAAGADVLVHEATFLHEERQRARQTGHTTARQAAELAREAAVGLLALVHISSRYAGGEVLAEARELFAATEVPRDFDAIDVPLPERGAPQLVRRQEDVARR